MAEPETTLFLAGDVMTGRGVDQVLPHPGDPALHEEYIDDARRYVDLAEAANGPVPRPVDVSWPWGDALQVLDAARPDVRIVNVETSITTSDDYEPDKGVHYRMHPRNLPCLAAVRPDVCVLANNHVLDFGTAGLLETLLALEGAGLRSAGAGRDLEEALRPAVVDTGAGRRVLVWSVASETSGVPVSWAAGPGRPGVALLPDLSAAGADQLARRVQHARRPGDLVVVSIHWGSNWGYGVPRAQTTFAHALVEAGVDVVHGHSSHHPRPVEIYRERLVLYGCGDLVDDYEGIRGYERYRDDLRLLYLVALDDTGRLRRLRMVPLQARRLRLEHAADLDTRWLREVLDGISRPFDVAVDLDTSGPRPTLGVTRR